MGCGASKESAPPGSVAFAGPPPHLQTDLEHLKVTLKADLRAELKAELLAELRENKPAAAVEAPATVQRKASVAMVPITYEEAFVAIGGELELAKHMEASRQLQARVSDATLDAELKLLLPRDYTKRTGFSTKLINQPFVRDLDALYAQANAIYGSYDQCIRELAVKLGAKALVPPLKGEVRARMKAIFKYRDVSSEGVAWYRLTDLVRATLEFGDLASLYAGLQAVVDHFGEGVQELNDRYMQPLAGGYRDIQLVVRFEGHMCELQLSTEPMTRAKKTTGHRDFEVVRELTAAVAEGNLGRVVNALEFGREHLGSSGDGASALSKLLRSDAANTLPHDAAARGHAEILHAFLLHGADANAQDGDGDTPLHCAVFGGHERCVWVLLDVGRPNLDVLNSDGQTPLVKGYLMLWQRPPEQAVRAVSTLAQVAGVARVKAARNVVDEQVRKKLSNNRALVDVAADGNCEKMLAELREYGDPNSRDKEGQSALEATITNGKHDAFNLLLDFKVSLKNLDGKPSLLELASTAGQPALVQALLELASERMELELLLDSLGALRVIGELEPKLIVPFAAGIATKLSGGSLGMRIAAVSVLDRLEPSALPSGAATLMDTNRLSVSDRKAEPNFAALHTLESFRGKDGKIELRQFWPDNEELQAQHWKQRSNPYQKRSAGVEGYEAIDCPHSANNWGGLEAGHAEALLNGSVGDFWFYALGSYAAWEGGIPGPSLVPIKCVELHAREPGDGKWVLVMRQTVNGNWWPRGLWSTD